MKRLCLALALVGLSFPSMGMAQPLIIGGYDVARIALATSEVLVEAGILSATEAAGLCKPIEGRAQGDPLVAAAGVADFYDGLGALLTARKLVTEDDLRAAISIASESGGVKVSGANPVVLAASYLDLLARRGAIAIERAQAILDDAKAGRRPVERGGT